MNADHTSAKRDATPTTMDYLAQSSDAAKVRRALNTLGISYTENPWQPGIRQFVVDASNPEKLRKVFG